jgi:hypothetical protein
VGGNGGAQPANVSVPSFSAGGSSPRGGSGTFGVTGANGAIPGGGAASGSSDTNTYSGGRGQINIWWV